MPAQTPLPICARWGRIGQRAPPAPARSPSSSTDSPGYAHRPSAATPPSTPRSAGLRRRPAPHGWRIIYLGADTPLADLVHTVAEKRPDVVILAAVTPERFQESIPDLIALARTAPLRLAGAGATTSIADTVGATILAGDPITEAQRLTPLS